MLFFISPKKYTFVSKFNKTDESKRKSPDEYFDVARRAGVSRGTVDRVVHKRGRVSQKTIAKVQKAIAELGYTPNPNASSLASKREYTFTCLIPKFHKGEYWEKSTTDFNRGLKHCRTIISY